jgi:hypothetical protein
MKGVGTMNLWFKAMHAYNKSLVKEMIGVMTEGFSILGFIAVMLGIVMLIFFNILFVLCFIATALIFAIRMLLAVPIGMIKYGSDWKTYVAGFSSGMVLSITEKCEDLYKKASEWDDEG